jgi:eukaryotic-like serine/threonine-protein kinase
METGARLGPYEVVARIGAGGMGVVYRARDTRLGREVAIKVVTEAFSQDPDRLKRFEQEARATSALSHPNIVSVFDVGSEAGQFYVVTEFLQGMTLRQAIREGSLPARKLISYGEQIALGMAAAHSQGIVHRDLKPENIFLTKDGRIKILDFGIAKLDPKAAAVESAEAVTVTQPGVLMGTAGYMSPEQVRGEAVDARSDIFSFGSVLYEMAAGKPAFNGETPVEVMTAILRKEPDPLTGPLEDVVRRCLEKKREDRFQSARDLAFTLETLARTTTQSRTPLAPSSGVTRRRLLPWAIGAPAVAALGGAWYVGRATAPKPRVDFRRITFRRGYVTSARYSPDGQTIIYGAAWGGEGVRLYSGRPDQPEYRALDLPPAHILAISSKSEMAMLGANRPQAPMEREGTLLVAPLAGGAPRELIKGVQSADWSPGGDQLAIVRPFARYRLEYPAGKTLYETDGKIADPRVAPDGAVVAYIDQPRAGDDAGFVAIIDRSGQRKRLSRDWRSCQGLAWSPKGDELFYTAASRSGGRQLYAVSLAGRERTVASEADRLLLHDVARSGQCLVTHEMYRYGLIASDGGEQGEKDITWLDTGQLSDIAPDGKTVMFHEGGAAVGGKPLAYLRRLKETQPVQLGAGLHPMLSPDGQWAACLTNDAKTEIMLLPVGAGESRKLARGALENINYVRWLRSSRGLLVSGSEKGRQTRIYAQDIESGVPQPISPEDVGLCAAPLTPDGRFCVGCSHGTGFLVPVEGGPARPLPGFKRGDEVIAFSADGRLAYVQLLGTTPAQVEQLEIATGKRSPWRTFLPANLAGITGVGPISLAPDLRAYAYNYESLVSELYAVDGVL